MTATHPALLPSLLTLAVPMLMLLRRFQRLAGPQTLDTRGRRRLVLRAALLLLATGLIVPTRYSPAAQPAVALGTLVGAGLALWSARHTHFDRGADGHTTRYVPNVWIGGGVFLLFVLRLLWRLQPLLTGQGQTAGTQGFDPSAFVSSSPLTAGLFLVFAAYQSVYPALVLRAADAPHPV